jgi:ribonuclease VapC
LSALVVDSSVILAAILGEAGGDVVYERIDEAVISAVNVAEVYTYAAVNNFSTVSIDAFFADTHIEIAVLSHQSAVKTGLLAAITKKAGLSLGDRACLALALERNAEVLTADRPWKKLEGELKLNIGLLR